MHSPASMTNLQINQCRLFLQPSQLALSTKLLNDLFYQQVLRVLDALAAEVASTYAVQVESRWLGYQQKIEQLKRFNPDMAEVKRFDGLLSESAWFEQVLQGLQINAQDNVSNKQIITVQQDNKQQVILQQLQQFVLQIRQLLQYE